MSKGGRFAYQRTRQTRLHWKKNKRSPALLWTTWRDSAVINHNFFDARRCDEAKRRGEVRRNSPRPGELLSVMVADDKARVQFFDRPRRREATGESIHERSLALHRWRFRIFDFPPKR